MIECLILGDSIATGIAQARPECVMQATVGITSSAFNAKYKSHPQAKTIIISLGTNDDDSSNTFTALSQLRESLLTSQIIWILPNRRVKTTQHAFVSLVASAHNDIVVDVTRVALSGDKIHPTQAGYKALAELTR